MNLIRTDKHYIYDTVIVHNIVDGDTYDLYPVVDIGFRVFPRFEQRFRLQNIDTPETRRIPQRKVTLAEIEHGQKAKAFVTELLMGIGIKQLYTYKIQGEYNRWSCDIILKDGSDLATVLKDHGLERRTDYPPDPVVL